MRPEHASQKEIHLKSSKVLHREGSSVKAVAATANGFVYVGDGDGRLTVLRLPKLSQGTDPETLEKDLALPEDMLTARLHQSVEAYEDDTFADSSADK